MHKMTWDIWSYVISTPLGVYIMQSEIQISTYVVKSLIAVFR